uniref:Uncharacterized LOC100178257 n=1 Tax=Ciona intestinalis TaxID=7719 RepID=H2XLC9_CIOIN|nr:uncharacterized protein LOC100178257 [Ciona intestinalis]|eukprot:XP_026695036.1 uncharacterized protein LOC100178257 [Ciona intestinalis]
MEKSLCKIAFVGTAVSFTLYLLFGANKFVRSFIDLHGSDPATVSAKYHVPFAPSKPLIAIAWPLDFISTMIAELYLISIVHQKQIFPKVFYLSWIVGAVTSSIWTFAFAKELHVISFASIILKLLLLGMQLTVGMIVMKKSEVITERQRWFLERIVMDSLGILTTWTITAFSAIVTHVLAWEYSAHLEVPVFRDWISFEVACIAGIGTLVTSFAIWTICDLVLFPSYTSCIRTVYPMYVFGGIGIFLSNYDAEKGLNGYNVICLILGLVASVIFIYRNKIKGDANKQKDF